MRHRTVLLAGFAAIAAAAIVACTLNPQPLPPEGFSNASDSDAAAHDSGRFGGDPAVSPQDAGGTAKDSDADAGADASDGRDAADAETTD